MNISQINFHLLLPWISHSVISCLLAITSYIFNKAYKCNIPALVRNYLATPNSFMSRKIVVFQETSVFNLICASCSLRRGLCEVKRGQMNGSVKRLVGYYYSNLSYGTLPRILAFAHKTMCVFSHSVISALLWPHGL